MTEMQTDDVQNNEVLSFCSARSLLRKNFPDMFVRGDKGKLLIRRDLVVGKDNEAYWIVQTGQDSGKLVEKVNHYTEGKQKRNAFEQAVSECESKRKGKSKKDKYVEGRQNAINVEDADLPPPMLATALKDTKVVYPCFAQRKLDGNRCLTRVKPFGPKPGTIGTAGHTYVMWSRQGNKFQGFGHIETALDELVHKAVAKGLIDWKELDGELIFDGELYTLEYPFQELNGVLKLDHLNPDDFEPDSKQHKKALENQERKSKVQYWVYDLAIKGMPQHKRGDLLHKLFDNAGYHRGSIKTRAKEAPVVYEPYIQVNTQQQLDEFHSRTVGDGFEGTIARMYDAGYIFKKRSKELVKIKDFHDEEFDCIGMRENDKLPGTGTFICMTKEGHQFEAMPEGSMEERKAMYILRDTFKGKKLNVKYFEKYPETGIPRFPVARVRDEK